MPQSRKKFVKFLAHITTNNRMLLEADAAARYGEIERNLSPALRDMLDFVKDHYTLFLAWVAARGNSPQ
jgi:hypothetical protein